MQAVHLPWAPPTGVLGRILSETAARVQALRRGEGAVEAAAAGAPAAPSLASALRASYVTLIAEIKRRSPSSGTINASLTAATQARAYAAGGAAAVSVLTEPAHFGGSAEDLAEVRRAVDLPLLRKDFIIDPLQIAEARALGASAVLLIARALPPALLTELVAATRERGVDPLVEVRSEAELARALATGAALIGINNRDLETLEVDPHVSERLTPLVPPDRIAISESGVRTVADVERAAAAGADAVLVGSSLSAAQDPAGAVRALTRVARRGRRG